MAGKGDTYRKVDKKKWDANWDLAFGKSKKSKSQDKKTINTSTKFIANTIAIRGGVRHIKTL